MKRRVTLAGIGMLTVAALVSASAPGSAGADGNTTGGSAYSAGFYANTPTGSIAPVPSVNLLNVQAGLLGSALNLLGINNLASLSSSLLTSVANPLATSLSALPQTMLSGLSTAITNSGTAASNSSTQQPRPSSGYPTCDQGGWTSGSDGNCYGPLLPAISVPSLLTISSGATQGYATGDASGYTAAARIADPVISLLGMPIGDLGVVASTASCGLPAAPNCTSTQTVSGISLLAGAVTATVADGAFTTVKVNGLSIPASGVTLTNVGSITSVGVKATSTLVSLSINLTLNQLLGALGTSLSTLTSALGLNVSLGDTGTTATLTVNIGPSGLPSSGATAANAYGLAVTASLTADIKLGVSVDLGLLGVVNLANVEVKTSQTTSPPNLLDLDVGYAAVVAGSPLASWIPVAAI